MDRSSSQSRIRLARRHARLSQAQVAALCGVQRSAVSHWEANSSTLPSMTNLRRLAEATGVHVEWLATGRGPMTVDSAYAMDSVAAAHGMLLEDRLEIRLIEAVRTMPGSARLPLVEIAEHMARAQRGRKAKSLQLEDWQPADSESSM